MPAKLRVGVVSGRLAHGPVQPVYGNKSERVCADIAGNFVDCFLRRDQLVFVGRINPIKTGAGGGRAGNPHMHLSGTSGAHH